MTAYTCPDSMQKANVGQEALGFKASRAKATSSRFFDQPFSRMSYKTAAMCSKQCVLGLAMWREELCQIYLNMYISERPRAKHTMPHSHKQRFIAICAGHTAMPLVSTSARLHLRIALKLSNTQYPPANDRALGPCFVKSCATPNFATQSATSCSIPTCAAKSKCADTT